MEENKKKKFEKKLQGVLNQIEEYLGDESTQEYFLEYITVFFEKFKNGGDKDYLNVFISFLKNIFEIENIENSELIKLKLSALLLVNTMLNRFQLEKDNLSSLIKKLEKNLISYLFNYFLKLNKIINKKGYIKNQLYEISLCCLWEIFEKFCIFQKKSKKFHEMFERIKTDFTNYEDLKKNSYNFSFDIVNEKTNIFKIIEYPQSSYSDLNLMKFKEIMKNLEKKRETLYKQLDTSNCEEFDIEVQKFFSEIIELQKFLKNNRHFEIPAKMNNILNKEMKFFDFLYYDVQMFIEKNEYDFQTILEMIFEKYGEIYFNSQEDIEDENSFNNNSEKSLIIPDIKSNESSNNEESTENDFIKNYFDPKLSEFLISENTNKGINLNEDEDEDVDKNLKFKSKTLINNSKFLKSAENNISNNQESDHSVKNLEVAENSIFNTFQKKDHVPKNNKKSIFLENSKEKNNTNENDDKEKLRNSNEILNQQKTIKENKDLKKTVNNKNKSYTLENLNEQKTIKENDDQKKQKKSFRNFFEDSNKLEIPELLKKSTFSLSNSLAGRKKKKGNVVINMKKSRNNSETSYKMIDSSNMLNIVPIDKQKICKSIELYEEPNKERKSLNILKKPLPNIKVSQNDFSGYDLEKPFDNFDFENKRNVFGSISDMQENSKNFIFENNNKKNEDNVRESSPFIYEDNKKELPIDNAHKLKFYSEKKNKKSNRSNLVSGNEDFNIYNKKSIISMENSFDNDNLPQNISENFQDKKFEKISDFKKNISTNFESQKNQLNTNERFKRNNEEVEKKENANEKEILNHYKINEEKKRNSIFGPDDFKSVEETESLIGEMENMSKISNLILDSVKNTNQNKMDSLNLTSINDQFSVMSKMPENFLKKNKKESLFSKDRNGRESYDINPTEKYKISNFKKFENKYINQERDVNNIIQSERNTGDKFLNIEYKLLKESHEKILAENEKLKRDLEKNQEKMERENKLVEEYKNKIFQLETELLSEKELNKIYKENIHIERKNMKKELSEEHVLLKQSKNDYDQMKKSLLKQVDDNRNVYKEQIKILIKNNVSLKNVSFEKIDEILGTVRILKTESNNFLEEIEKKFRNFQTELKKIKSLKIQPPKYKEKKSFIKSLHEKIFFLKQDLYLCIENFEKEKKNYFNIIKNLKKKLENNNDFLYDKKNIFSENSKKDKDEKKIKMENEPIRSDLFLKEYQELEKSKNSLTKNNKKLIEENIELKKDNLVNKLKKDEYLKIMEELEKENKSLLEKNKEILNNYEKRISKFEEELKKKSELKTEEKEKVFNIYNSQNISNNNNQYTIINNFGMMKKSSLFFKKDRKNDARQNNEDQTDLKFKGETFINKMDFMLGLLDKKTNNTNNGQQKLSDIFAAKKYDLNFIKSLYRKKYVIFQKNQIQIFVEEKIKEKNDFYFVNLKIEIFNKSVNDYRFFGFKLTSSSKYVKIGNYKAKNFEIKKQQKLGFDFDIIIKEKYFLNFDSIILHFDYLSSEKVNNYIKPVSQKFVNDTPIKNISSDKKLNNKEINEEILLPFSILKFIKYKKEENFRYLIVNDLTKVFSEKIEKYDLNIKKEIFNIFENIVEYEKTKFGVKLITSFSTAFLVIDFTLNCVINIYAMNNHHVFEEFGKSLVFILQNFFI